MPGDRKDKQGRSPSRGQPGAGSDRRSLGEVLSEWRDRNSVLVLLFLASSLVTAISVLAIAALNVYDRYQRHFEWRSLEYDRLTSLRAGFPLAKFNQVLGEPVFVEPWAPHTTQLIYRGRGYWVRAVEDATGNVQQYAVTSCDRSFRPTFVLYPLADLHVTLQRSTLNSVLKLMHFGVAAEQLVETKLVNAAHTLQFYDTLDGAGPAVYKSFAWGFDDACPAGSNFDRELGGDYDAPLAGAPPALKRAELAATVNTYAETASTVPFARVSSLHFAIGVHPQTVQLLP
jgi:hypothetical protein